MIITKSGVAIRMNVDSIRTMGRATQGVRLINLKGTSEIAAIARVPRGDEDEAGEEIELSGDENIVRNIKMILNKIGNGSNEKNIQIFGEITYEKSSQTKDLAGNTTQYRLMTKSEFKIISNKEEINFLIKENFDMKNFNDEFEEKKYEDTIKENFAKSISNKLLLQISRLK